MQSLVGPLATESDHAAGGGGSAEGAVLEENEDDLMSNTLQPGIDEAHLDRTWRRWA